MPLSPYRRGVLTDLQPATVVAFREAQTGEYGFHKPERRQLVVCLSGKLEVECGDGTKRIFGPGDVMLADDATGEGHRSRDIEGPRRSLWIGIPEDLDVSAWRVPSGDTQSADAQDAETATSA